MMRYCGPVTWLLFGCLSVHAAGNDLLVHCAFDGSAESKGRLKVEAKPVGQVEYVDGLRGKAVSLTRESYLDLHAEGIIPKAQGTVEFWVKPNWDVVPRADGPASALAHTFFNMGPIRPDHPQLSNHSSLTISHQSYSSLHCVIADRHYKSRSVSCPIRDWRRGQWHHVALQWQLDDAGNAAMQLFIDGRLATDRVHANKPGKMNMSLPALPIQIGAMNTGYAPADAAIDELRISNVPRYGGEGTVPFSPAKRPTPDAHTLALFHFDGTLAAAPPGGLTASAGSAQ